MLVEWRRNDALALHIAEEATRQDIGFAGRIMVIDREDRIVAPEYGDLPAIHQRADTRVGQHIGQLADANPTHTAALARSRRSARVAGRIWPRSWTNITLESVASLLTKWRNLLSV